MTGCGLSESTSKRVRITGACQCQENHLAEPLLRNLLCPVLCKRPGQRRATLTTIGTTRQRCVTDVTDVEHSRNRSVAPAVENHRIKRHFRLHDGTLILRTECSRSIEGHPPQRDFLFVFRVRFAFVLSWNFFLSQTPREHARSNVCGTSRLIFQSPSTMHTTLRREILPSNSDEIASARRYRRTAEEGRVGGGGNRRSRETSDQLQPACSLPEESCLA